MIDPKNPSVHLHELAARVQPGPTHEAGELRPDVVEHFVRCIQDDELCTRVDGAFVGELAKHLDLSGVIRVVVERLLEHLHQDGYCSYDFHVSEADWFPDGRCCNCGEQREHANHRSVVVCSTEHAELAPEARTL